MLEKGVDERKKIIDRKLLADLTKEVGLNASHLEALGETVNGRLSLVAICLNGWLRYNIGSSD